MRAASKRPRPSRLRSLSTRASGAGADHADKKMLAAFIFSVDVMEEGSGGKRLAPLMAIMNNGLSSAG
jgi:hypothetical protein